MRINFKNVAGGAIALLAIASCAKEQKTETNPAYNPDTKEVTANFVFSVSTSNTPTKQSADIVQASLDNSFRGIDNAELLTYKLGTTNDGKHIAEAAEANKVFSLGVALTSGSLTNSGTTQSEGRRVLEIALPTETNALVFYGKAISSGTDDQNGKIGWNVSKDISSNTFSLTPRISGDAKTNFQQYQKLIALVLNRIVRNGFNGNSVDRENTETRTVTFGDPVQTFSSELNWSDYVEVDGDALKIREKSPVVTTNDLSPLEEILADAFLKFNTLYAGEIRAGSGPAVARTIGDLWDVVNKVASATPTSLEEAVAKAMAERLQTRFFNYFTEKGVNCKWSSISTVKANLKSHLKTADQATFDSDYAGVTDDLNLNAFPTNFGVPFGATQLSYAVATRTYTYTENLPMSGMGGGVVTPYDYMYPAELCYFGNSPIRVTNDAHVTNDYPNPIADWNNDAQWAAGVNNNTNAWTKNGHVLSTTRSVAMQENVNYGTALLKTTVRYGAATLKDNNAAIQLARNGSTEVDSSIEVSADSFTLTGVIIGGQEAEMGWNYVAKAADPKFTSMIYDRDITSTAIPAYTAGGAKSQPNYTLVWDNWNKTLAGGSQNTVYVALEFKNNTGKDFWGQHNLVRAGGTFYIIGKLDPDTGLSTSDFSDGITWPTLYALPPYNSDGSTIKERRIFIQDYVTEANFVIGENSLKSAYVTVPDLRSAQVSFGLSVDLNWQSGLAFENVVLGE